MILTALLWALAVSYGAPTEDELRGVEKNWASTVTSGNLAAIEQILGDQLIYAHSSGVIETKREYLARLRTGQQKYDRIEHQSMNVKVYGETAVVHCKVRMTGSSNAKPFDDQLMMMHVWVKQGGKWLLAAHQTTRLL